MTILNEMSNLNNAHTTLTAMAESFEHYEMAAKRIWQLEASNLAAYSIAWRK